jgi:phytoene synthase
MAFQEERVEGLYAEAAELLPKEDFKSLLAPRVMHQIYYTLLHRMRDDGFRVFEKRYRLSKLQKITLLLKERFVRQK